MKAIRTAGVVVAAGLLVGCAQKREQPRVVAPEPQPIQAAEQLRQSLTRANPNARVGIVAATVGRFAAVRDVPAGAVAEDATVQILDANGEVVGYGMVRAVKNDTIHVLYQPDTRRGPQIGDLVMPATDAGVPVQEMPAAAPMRPEPQQAAEPSRLPPRRAASPEQAPAPAETQAPTGRDTTAQQQQPAAQPQQPAPSLKEENPPADFQPATPGNAGKAALPPVEGGTDASQPAKGADATQQKSPGDTNGAAPAGGAAEPAQQGKAGDAGAPAGDAGQAGTTDKGAASDGKAAGEQPSLNK
jgi:hypothetical protein